MLECSDLAVIESLGSGGLKTKTPLDSEIQPVKSGKAEEVIVGGL